jgi:hypothetical protein
MTTTERTNGMDTNQVNAFVGELADAIEKALPGWSAETPVRDRKGRDCLSVIEIGTGRRVLLGVLLPNS